jgi:AcrR family transcriptional regulator
MVSREYIAHPAASVNIQRTEMSDQKRPYRMRRRAELEEQTRRRITESTVALHEELGPARTSISAIAERAGVRRSTVYRHFPDEETLFRACSSHWRAANPPPDLGAWAAIESPEQRTETALRELYGFFRRTQGMYASLLRDEPLVPIVRRGLRDFHGYLGKGRDVLIAGRGLRGRAAGRTRAAIGHALEFPTWHSLTHEQGLTDDEAAALMCLLIENTARARSRR